MSIFKGDVVRLAADFTDPAAALVDPGVVTCKVQDPAGAVVTYAGGAIVRDSLGRYHVDVPIALSGRHYYRWIGTGANAAAEEGSFLADPSASGF